nr:hypothetical protein [Sinorhizobium meliloti]
MTDSDRPTAKKKPMKVATAIAPVFMSNAMVRRNREHGSTQARAPGGRPIRRNFDDGRHRLGDARDGAWISAGLFGEGQSNNACKSFGELAHKWDRHVATNLANSGQSGWPGFDG